MRAGKLVGLSIVTVVCLLGIDSYGLPSLINFQGRLVDPGGNALVGTQQVTFALYDAPTDGALLWSETQAVVLGSSDSGIYNVLLGSSNALNLAFSQDCWLGVKVGGDTEMTPRFRLATVPYAFRAASLQGNNVTRIVAGTDVTVSPTSGVGEVTVNAVGVQRDMGAIVLGSTTNPTPANGTIRWSGKNFEGYMNGAWVSLTGPVTEPVVDAMVQVPGGTFLMGLIADGMTTQQVTISSFYLSKYEVTYGLWYDVRQWAKTNGYSIQGLGREGNDGTDGSVPTAAMNEPVTMVSWRDAVVWCNARSEKEGLEPVYTFGGDILRDSADTAACDAAVFNVDRDGYRLPTEAEWECAARYQDGASWTPGNWPSGATSSWQNAAACDGVGWYSANSGGSTRPVATKTANQLGIFDMSGNVWEWCWDWYAAYGGAVTNPIGPAGPITYRVRRGSSSFNDADTLQSTTRSANSPPFKNYYLGLRCARGGVPANFLVIDLAAGPSATSYPVTSLAAVPDGGWGDEYKTTKMVLRRISPGTFTMGSPTNEIGRWDIETQHQVTLTQPFYIGIFEVTQKQWERVMGTWPSYFNNTAYCDARPVESVTYSDIRGATAGAGWPTHNNVDADSFMGRLRTRTGRVFDLPTEAQWEYAGRAGTTTALSSGYNLTNASSDARMSEVGRYKYNGGMGASRSSDTSTGSAKVGSYLENPWGLYDIHGNVWEWGLDWTAGDLVTAATNPVGEVTGSYRIHRGGGWDVDAYYSRSAFRGGRIPSAPHYTLGLRVSAPAVP